jgi:hypothetical protein
LTDFEIKVNLSLNFHLCFSLSESISILFGTDPQILAAVRAAVALLGEPAQDAWGVEMVAAS